MKMKETYVVRCFDTELFSFDYAVDSIGQKTVSLNDYASDLRKMMPLQLVPGPDDKALESWIETRTIPKNRAFVKEILKSAGLSSNDTIGILNVCKGLSVNDAFSIVKRDERLSFDEINLYDHDFDKTLSLVAYTGYTSSQRHRAGLSPEWTTDGSFAKAWRKMDGDLVLFKAGSSGFANAGMEPYSEYFASQIADAMGIPHVAYDLQQWKGKLASTCRLMGSKEVGFVPYYSATSHAVWPQIGKISLDAGQRYSAAMRTMLVFDSVVANVDRHGNNHGFLRNNRTGEIVGPAPLFDHNMSLFCRDMESDYEGWPDSVKSLRPAMSELGFNELDALVMSEESHEQIRRLLTFELKNHPVYPVAEGRLAALNDYIGARAKELLKVPVVSDADYESSLKSVTMIRDTIPLKSLEALFGGQQRCDRQIPPRAKDGSPGSPAEERARYRSIGEAVRRKANGAKRERGRIR